MIANKQPSSNGFDLQLRKFANLDFWICIDCFLHTPRDSFNFSAAEA